MTTVISLEALERQVCRTLEAQDLDRLRMILTAQHPADIADVIDRLDDEEQITVFRLLSPQQAAEVLDETNPETTRVLIQHLPSDQIADLLDLMPPDDVAEILSEDVPEQQQALLAAMEAEEAEEVRELLTYPPRSAGRLMSENFVQVSLEMTAVEAMEHLRQVEPEVETISYLYALNDVGELIGVVSLRDVITALPMQRLVDLMQTRIISVTPETDQEEVARLVSQYDLLALPVVTLDMRMLGVVTVDDVIDVLVQESTEDVLRFGAVEIGPDESYFSIPILQAVRRRVGWLMILFLTGTLTINVLGRFESELEQVVALSFFIPLLIGTGGNTGAQTVSTMVRGMALGDIRLSDAWRVIVRELGSGLVLGLILATVAFGLALLLSNSLQLAVVVALSIIAVCAWANTMGAVVPLIAHWVGLDPALVSAPLITTLVDATGLLIYLMIAKTLLGL